MSEIRPIDANALKEKISKGLPAMSPGEYIKVELVIRSIINEQPTLDYEPVVHCKNCVHKVKRYGMNVCTVLGRQIKTSNDFYCSYGRAKTDKEV